MPSGVMIGTEGASAVAELVLRARSGDGGAFDALYRRFARSVHGVLISRLSAAEAEEGVQEAFLLAHRRLGTLREPEAFGAWIHAIARNVANGRLRARRPTESLPSDAAAPSEDDELRSRVVELIRGLPEAYRETLMMRLVDGLDGPEIAEQTGLTPASVRVNLCRGMEALRELLRREGWP
jgi:RNA polymerase sigma-70 factor (ECF subfamily)